MSDLRKHNMLFYLSLVDAQMTDFIILKSLQ